MCDASVLGKRGERSWKAEDVDERNRRTFKGCLLKQLTRESICISTPSATVFTHALYAKELSLCYMMDQDYLACALNKEKAFVGVS